MKIHSLYFRTLSWHFLYSCLEMFRSPLWMTTTLVFPSMFFWFFGVPNASTPERSLILTSSFSAFAVLSIVVFQFGVSIAEERSRPWFDYSRTLPHHNWIPLFNRIFVGLFFSCLSVSLVFITSMICTDFPWTDFLLGRFLGQLFLGAIPFALLGMSIGLICSPKSAVPVANLIYLPLSFAGGLWVPPNALPSIVQKITPYLPTRIFGELVWSASLKKELDSSFLWGNLIYIFVFGTTAIWAWRKQEVSRYR